MEHYRERLRHVVRPEDPSERQPENRVMLEDYEALYLAQMLPSYAAYNADSKQEEDLCLAYAEYINNVIRNEEKGHVYVYAHTEEARGLLREIVETYMGGFDLDESIERKVEDNLGVSDAGP